MCCSTLNNVLQKNPRLTPERMDAIKKKMKSLAQATEEATARASIYEEERNRVNEIADKFEDQVREKLLLRATMASSWRFCRPPPCSSCATSRRRCSPWRPSSTRARSSCLRWRSSSRSRRRTWPTRRARADLWRAGESGLHAAVGVQWRTPF